MGPPAWACILCKHTVWEIHPRETYSRRNLWSTSRAKQLEPSQENGRIFKSSIEGENKNNSLALDEILGKVQKRTLSVMGPLSKVWLKMENAKKFGAPPLSPDEILSLLEQTICLLGQTSNSISYHRRYNILSSVCSPQEAKNMLKNKAELLQTNDEKCFGKEFSDHLTESVKSNQRKAPKKFF